METIRAVWTRCARVTVGAGLVFASAGGLGAAVAAPAAGAAVFTPYAHLVNHAFRAAPTTRQCVQYIGLACYSPKQFEVAYDMKSLYHQGLDGTGRTIAIVDAFGSPTIRDDLATFDDAFGLPAARLRIIRPVGDVPPFNPNDGTRVSWAVETTLDVEYAHAMAPGAKLLLVETPVAETEGVTGFPPIIRAENYVINHQMADVISQSFGATEQTFPDAAAIQKLRKAYKNAAAHNVSVLAASGDDGTSGAANKTGSLLYTHRVNSWPSSDPLVTSVGGTQLHLNSAGQRVDYDNVWNDTNRLGSPAASGGGVSSVFKRPDYQNHVSGVVGDRRGTPDISMTAAVDGAALVYLSFLGASNAGFYLVGGTSEATPIFSGVVAVADQAAHHDLGLLNYALYSLARSGAPGIQDVTTGDNAVTFFQQGQTYTVPGYLARQGYDLATGLGTVDGAQLVSELASP